MGGNGHIPAGPTHRLFRNRVFPVAEDILFLPGGGTVRIAVPAGFAEGDGAVFSFDGFENLRVGPPLGIPGLPVVEAAHTYIRSDKDANFTLALVTNAEEPENLVGLPTQVGNIEAITLMSVQNLDWEVAFYTRDTFNTNPDEDLQTWVDSVSFARADGRRIAAAGSFLYAAHGLKVPYRDQDATTEIHVGLINRDAVAKIAGAAGEVVLQLAFRPTV